MLHHLNKRNKIPLYNYYHNRGYIILQELVNVWTNWLPEAFLPRGFPIQHNCIVLTNEVLTPWFSSRGFAFLNPSRDFTIGYNFTII